MLAARVVDQVRRIGREQRCSPAREEPINVLSVGAVAAQQAMLAQEPQVAGLGDGPGFCLGERGVEVEVLQAVVDERFLYVSSGRDFVVIDASDPLAPHEVGRYTYRGTAREGTDNAGLRESAVSGTRTYVWWGTGRVSGVRILDLTDPAAPNELGTYPLGVGPVPSLAAAGNHLYVPRGGLEIVDASDPQRTSEVGFYPSGVGMPSLSVEASGRRYGANWGDTVVMESAGARRLGSRPPGLVIAGV